MDAITAGQAGAIVGNNSDATIDQSADVSAADDAQSGATAVNIVNSAHSAVANGVNVWSGTLTEYAEGDSGVR